MICFDTGHISVSAAKSKTVKNHPRESVSSVSSRGRRLADVQAFNSCTYSYTYAYLVNGD